MWIDLQETFYIVLAPFIFYLLLPAFVAGGITLGLVMLIMKVFKTR